MTEAAFSDELFEGTGEEASASTETAKCPSCGANLTYDPATQEMKCPYCGETVRIESTRSQEIDLTKLFTDRASEWNTETKVFRCINCGATTVIGRNELSKACAYCGASNIVETEEMSGMRPDSVLPFTITKEDAEKSAITWAKKKVFAPRKFKKSLSPEEISGNYIPAFTFDSDTDSSYHGTLGEYYYETRTVNGKTEQVRKVRYFKIRGTFHYFFDDVLVQASDRVSQKTVNKLSPFDTNDAQKYTAEFLHGFSATQYVRDGKTCWEDAKRIMYDEAKRRILAKYTYDVVADFHMDMRHKNVTFKYLLLPLYIGHYEFKKKIYNFFVNGRNGRVAGKVPVSAGKVLAVVGAVLAAIVGIVLLYLYYGGN